jgi:hypothetical protein
MISATAADSIFTFSPKSLLAWTASYALWEPISYFLIRAMSSAKTVGEYYDPKKTPVAVVFFGDYIYSTFLLLVAQQVIRYVLGGSGAWLIGLLLFLATQWIGDFSFFKFITALKPTTRYIDFFQRYTKEVSFNAILGDSAYAVVWLSLAQLMASMVPAWGQVTLISLFMFGTLVFSY